MPPDCPRGLRGQLAHKAQTGRMEGVLVLLFVIALVTLFCARKALQRAYTRSYRLPPHFQTSETPVHRASPHRSSCAIQRCSSVVILLATTTSRHLLLNCRQGDLPSEADHPRPPLSLPRSHFYSTVNHSLRVSPASRSQVQDRVIRPALHRQIT